MCSTMGELTVEIPDDLVELLGGGSEDRERELLKDLAVAFYMRGIPPAQARRVADLGRAEFEELLAERRVPRHYTDEDLDEDVSHGQGGR